MINVVLTAATTAALAIYNKNLVPWKIDLLILVNRANALF